MTNNNDLKRKWEHLLHYGIFATTWHTQARAKGKTINSNNKISTNFLTYLLGVFFTVFVIDYVSQGIFLWQHKTHILCAALLACLTAQWVHSEEEAHDRTHYLWAMRNCIVILVCFSISIYLFLYATFSSPKQFQCPATSTTLSITCPEA